MNRQERKEWYYDQTHKIIDGVSCKQCTVCNEWFPETIEYFYMKNKSNPKKGFKAECKECTKKQSLKNRNENIERARASYRDWYWRDQKNAKRVSNYNKKYYAADPQRKLIMAKEFRQKYPEIANAYTKKHRRHNINTVEWIACKDYFKNENGKWACAYCGRTEEESYKLWNEQLHREHVIHDGENDLSNCVSACKECNSEKHTDSFNDWYNKDNIKYNENRYSKIINWLHSDYKRYIITNKPKRKYVRKQPLNEVV